MKFYFGLAAGMLLGSSAALAADTTTNAAPTTGKLSAVCSTEIQKFCANVEHGKGKIRECLTQHTADLSDPCKQRLAEHASK
jgi:hypothetical protein